MISETRHSQGGVALLEVMIAILIISFGILGIIGLQANSIALTTDARYRVEAGAFAERLIAETLAMIEFKAHDKGLELRTEIATTLPAALRGDPLRLQQVLLNFLSNAVKFTDKGEVAYLVRGERLENGRVRFDFAVTDSGSGIAPDDLRTDQASTYQDYDSKKWTAQQSLTITVRQIDRAGEILTAANAAGAENVSGPGFGVEDQSAAYRDAIGRAMADARAKADAAAAMMGVRVTGIVSVDETGGEQPMVYAARAATEDSAGGAVPTELGTQDITSTLTVTFQYGQ